MSGTHVPWNILDEQSVSASLKRFLLPGFSLPKMSYAHLYQGRRRHALHYAQPWLKMELQGRLGNAEFYLSCQGSTLCSRPCLRLMPCLRTHPTHRCAQRILRPRNRASNEDNTAKYGSLVHVQIRQPDLISTCYTRVVAIRPPHLTINGRPLYAKRRNPDKQQVISTVAASPSV